MQSGTWSCLKFMLEIYAFQKTKFSRVMMNSWKKPTLSRGNLRKGLWSSYVTKYYIRMPISILRVSYGKAPACWWNRIYLPDNTWWFDWKGRKTKKNLLYLRVWKNCFEKKILVSNGETERFRNFIASNHTSKFRSPVVNAKGQLIGLNFDRSSEGIMRMYTILDLSRNIVVDIRLYFFDWQIWRLQKIDWRNENCKE